MRKKEVKKIIAGHIMDHRKPAHIQENGFQSLDTSLEQTGVSTFQTSSPVCPHYSYCNVKKISNRDCNSGNNDYETCQTYKFHSRYSEQLGIGAITEITHITGDKNI